MTKPMTLTIQDTAARISELIPAQTRPLAEPPAGSGLKPVMGDFGPPGVGRTIELTSDMVRFIRRRYSAFGPVHWTGVAGARTVLVAGPEALEVVLANRDKAFANKPGWERFIGPFFNRGVMLMDFEEHLHHRRIMQHAFTRDRLVSYLDVMNGAIEHGLSEWGSGHAFGIYPRVKQLTLDIATTVFMGEQLGAEADRLNAAFVACVLGGTSIVRADIPGSAWHRALGPCPHVVDTGFVVTRLLAA